MYSRGGEEDEEHEEGTVVVVVAITCSIVHSLKQHSNRRTCLQVL